MNARPLLVAALCALSLSAPGAALAQSIGVGVQAHSDDISLKGQQRIATGAAQDEDQDLISDGTFSASLWYLKQLSDRMRAGGGIRYYGTYGGLPADEEARTNDDGSEVDPYVLGTLIEVYGQAEWILPVAEKLRIDAVLGMQLGAQVLFPGGDFDEQITALQDQGAGVLGLPRVGVLFGPQVGARWRVMERLSIRLDVGLRYNRLFLFNTEEENDGIAFKKQWDLNVLRTDVGLGVEINL
jgi:hypothetical protein